MRDIIQNFGKNAGKIWEQLDKYGSIKQTKLIKMAKLRELDFFAAIGWLARENKILKEGIYYKLGDTNLNEKIGSNAGIIWQTLHSLGYVDSYFLPRVSGLTERETYSAIGWLAREGKLDAFIIKQRSPQIRYKLK